MNISRSFFRMGETRTPNRQTTRWYDEDEDQIYLGAANEGWAYYRVGGYNQDHGGEFWWDPLLDSFGSWEVIGTNHPWSLGL